MEGQTAATGWAVLLAFPVTNPTRPAQMITVCGSPQGHVGGLALNLQCVRRDSETVKRAEAVCPPYLNGCLAV
jgi:hypothetical protein